MADFSRKDIEARYRIFDRFALDDQRAYYKSILDRFRKALSQVNRLTALFSLLAGFAAAAVGLLVQSNYANNGACNLNQTIMPSNCNLIEALVNILMIISVMMPILAAFFNTLSDLYQWERMTTIYSTALENIEVADAQSPLPDMEDLVYKASVHAVVEGTLRVMNDESAQWGTSIRTPIAFEKFLNDEMNKASFISSYQSSSDKTFNSAAEDNSVPAYDPENEKNKKSRL